MARVDDELNIATQLSTAPAATLDDSTATVIPGDSHGAASLAAAAAVEPVATQPRSGSKSSSAADGPPPSPGSSSPGSAAWRSMKKVGLMSQSLNKLGAFQSESSREVQRKAQSRHIFEKLDVDGSGTLDLDEVVGAAAELSMTVEEASEWFQNLDTEKKGEVTLEEFMSNFNQARSQPQSPGLGALMDPRKIPSFSLKSTFKSEAMRDARRDLASRELFAKVDTDGSGILDLDEICAAASSTNMGVEEAAAWFEALGPEKKGDITQENFVSHYRSAYARNNFATAGLALLQQTPSRMARMANLKGYAQKWKDRAKASSLEEAMKKFRSIDADGSGDLTLLEILDGAPLLQLKQEDAQRWFGELDVDGSGTVNADEFLEKYRSSSVYASLVGAVAQSIEIVADGVGILAEGVGNLTRTISTNETLRATYSAADELGRGAIARAFKNTEIGALPLRLLKGHMVYSKNWKSDLWLHLKNKQIFLSLFFVHEDHPFSRSERISAVVVSCLIAWGMEFWFCALWTSCEEHPQYNFFELFLHVLLLKIAISASLNGLYDAILEMLLTCPCVQEGCPPIVKNLCETCSLVALLVQAAGGVIVIGLGAVALVGGLAAFGVPGQAEDFEDSEFYEYVLITIRELIIGKVVGLFVVTMLIESLAFFVGRKAQMKPSKSDTVARERWDKPQVSFFGIASPPPNELWNRFIGPDVEPEDLYDWAPTYDVDVHICCKKVYYEREDSPSSIPKWFRDEKFVASSAAKKLSQVSPINEALETEFDPEVGPFSNKASSASIEESAGTKLAMNEHYDL